MVNLMLLVHVRVCTKLIPCHMYSHSSDATPIAEATPTPGDGQEREAIDSESGMLTGDSAGNQSGDSKEGKRKSRLKFGLGGKKKKRLSSGEGGASGRGGNGDGADDKTPITRTPVGEPA